MHHDSLLQYRGQILACYNSLYAQHQLLDFCDIRTRDNEPPVSRFLIWHRYECVNLV